VFRVGVSCTTGGGVGGVVYEVSSLLKNFRVGMETMANRLRRGEREKRVERKDMLYTRRTQWKRGDNMR
jgi:hypothetical protein